MSFSLLAHARKLTALTVIAATYLLARLPEVSEEEGRKLAEKFQFHRSVFPDPEGALRNVRNVHPSLNHISAWISTVGAAVALNDLDGDGLSNDACWVDVRTDSVMVAPVPGTAERYPRQTLRPAPLDYDAKTMAPMGCLPGDVNEDGRMDLVVYYWGRTPIVFLRMGDDYRPTELTTNSERWFTNAAFFSDLDGDGHADLVIGNYFADGARILDKNDRHPQEMQHSMSQALNSGKKHIFLWKAPGKFQEVHDVLGNVAVKGWTLAAGAADLDGDLLPELYFSNDFGPDRLLHNRSTPGHLRFELVEGRRELTTPKSKVLGQDSYKGMGVDFADINGDGFPDIYVSNIAAPYALEESHFLFVSTGKPQLFKNGIAPYQDRSESLGVSRSAWGWDARLADFNNDGILEAIQAVGFTKGSVNRWPELHEIAMSNDQLLQTPAYWHSFRPGDDLSGQFGNPFFVRASDGRFYDIAERIGVGTPQLSRGIALADVDGDGRLDYAVANQWESSAIYRNQSRDAGRALVLSIVNENGGPMIGSVASVQLPNGKKIVAQVDGGSGHSGKKSPEIHFGLGEISAETRLPVTLKWRDAAGVHEKSELLTPGRHRISLERKTL